MREYVKPVIVLMVVAFASAVSLSQVYERTRERIAFNKKLELIRALERVLPEYDNEPDADSFSAVSPGGYPVTFYRGRRGGDLSGVAFRVATREGYSGTIVLLGGVDLQREITGVEILEHLETPGLGDRIIREDFRSQFRGKRIDAPDPGDWKVKKDGGVFDSLTGATISSRAVVRSLREGLEAMAGRWDEIAGGKGR